MEKMKVIYEQNPALGDAQQVAQRLLENQAKIEELQAEMEEFKVMIRSYLNRRAVFKATFSCNGIYHLMFGFTRAVYMPHPPNLIVFLTV